MATTLQTLQGIQAQIHGLSAYSSAPALLQAINSALAQPSPPGNPGQLAYYGQSLSAIGSQWAALQADLTTIATNRIPAVWHSGETSAEATGLVTTTATDLQALPAAFTAAVSALNEWSITLGKAQNLDAEARTLLGEAVADLKRIHADASSFDWSWSLDDPHGSSDREQAFRNAYADAGEGMDELVQAAADAWYGGQQVASVLQELATTGIPAMPGAGATEGATAALAAFNAAAPTLGTPIADARQAAGLMQLEADGTALTPAQQAQLNSYLSADEHNPQFATALLEELGPQGFVTLISRSTPAQIDAEAAILATATSDTPGQPSLDQAWITELEAVGRASFTPGSEETPVRGYAELSRLLGDPNAPVFSQQFLLAIGNDMVAYDAVNGSNAWWPRGVPYNENGDPLVGYMAALSKNPGAATQFFGENPQTIAGQSSGSLPTSMVDYMLHRTWHDEQLGNVDGYHGYLQVTSPPGPGQLGAALEAATSNTSAPASRSVMADVVSVLGKDYNGNIPGGMGPAVTHMMIDYIESGDVNDAFGNNDSGLFIPQDLTSVLNNLSQDPTQYRLLNGAELGHLAQTIQSYVPQPSSDGDTAFNYDMDSGGTLLGIFSHGRAEGIANANAAYDAQANKPVDTLAGIANYVLGKLPVPSLFPGSGYVVPQGENALVGNIVSGLSTDTSSNTVPQIVQSGDGDYSTIKQFIDDVAKTNPYLNGPNSDPSGRILGGFRNETDPLAPLPSSP